MSRRAGGLVIMYSFLWSLMDSSRAPRRAQVPVYRGELERPPKGREYCLFLGCAFRVFHDTQMIVVASVG